MNWGDFGMPFPKPTLILVGENDTDVPESTLRWLEMQAARYSHVHFHRIKDAEHNVLKGRAILDAAGVKIGEYDPAEAFAIIHRFFRKYR
jgi:pimeloyl-ACP methyl ester carboxylesterase